MPTAAPPQTYLQLYMILCRYVSPITVDAMLSNAWRDAKGQDGDPKSIERVMQHLMPAIRMFCRPEQVTDLMLELASVLE